MIKSFLINVSHPWGNLGSDYLQTKANMNKVPFLLHSFIHSFVCSFIYWVCIVMVYCVVVRGKLAGVGFLFIACDPGKR